MRTILFVTAAALALTGCNQGVSLTNATPEEAAKAMKFQGLAMKGPSSDPIRFKSPPCDR